MTEILVCMTVALVMVAILLFKRGVYARRQEEWDDRFARTGVRIKRNRLPEKSMHILRTPFMAKDTPSRDFTPSQFLVERVLRRTASPRFAQQAPLILSLFTACLALGATVGVVAGVDFELKNWREILILLLIAAFSGYLAGSLVVRALFISWRSNLSRQAPDVINYLMLAVEAGVHIDIALIEVSRILKPFAPAMAHEVGRLSSDLAILPSREVAFQKLVHRTNVETFIFLKQALLQGEKYGTPIVASLKVVADDSRRHILRKKQERARRLPVFISIPLMLLILPPIIAVSTGPGFIQLMRTF